MFPVMLDLSRVSVLLVGNGARAVRRLALLREGGAVCVQVFADQPDAELCAAAGHDLIRRPPAAEDFCGVAAVFFVDVPLDTARALAGLARAAGAWVNVEDNRELCDFYTPSLVRRGDLVVAVSTGGKSPALAQRFRVWLERLLPPEWATRLEDLAVLRQGWRRDGADMITIARRTDALIADKGWLPLPASVAQDTSPPVNYKNNLSDRPKPE